MMNEIGQYRMLYGSISYQRELYMINEIGQYRMLYGSISYTVFSWRINMNCNFFIIIVQKEKKNAEKIKQCIFLLCLHAAP